MQRRKSTTEPESSVLRSVTQYLALCPGIFAWRSNTGAQYISSPGGKRPRFVRFGIPGLADLIGVCELTDPVTLLKRYGVFLAIECKNSDGGKLSLAQEAFLKAIRERGGIALVVCSVEDLRRQLREAGIDTP